MVIREAIDSAPSGYTTFGDVCLEDMGVVVEYIHDDPPTARLETKEVPGRDGVRVTGVTRGDMEVTLDCRAFLERWQEYDGLLSFLGTLVGTSGELSLRSRPEEPYTAYLTSVKSGERMGLSGIGEVFLTFTVPDPTREGETVSVSVPSGGSATFTVNGNLSPKITISATAAVRNGTSHLWGVRFDGGSFVRVNIPTSNSTAIEIDCSERTAKVGGATSMITLDSDWPELSQGEHTVQMDVGTGAATMTVTERWS